MDQLHAQLRDQRLMIRIRKEDVLTQLPAKRHTVIPLELSDPNEYKHAHKDFIGWLRKKRRGGLRKAEKAQRLVQMAHLRRLAGLLKLPAVMEWVDNFLASSDEKLILFAHHLEVIAKLQKKYRKCCAVVTGSVKGKERQAQFTKFNTHPSCRLFIGNIQAAGVGWSARGTATVVFVEYPWSPSHLLQCEDRLHGIGRGIKDRRVDIIYLVAKKTIEEKLIALLQEKQRIATKIIDGAQVKNNLDIFDLLCSALEKDDVI